jgi:hypothetical protein
MTGVGQEEKIPCFQFLGGFRDGADHRGARRGAGQEQFPAGEPPRLGQRDHVARIQLARR